MRMTVKGKIVSGQFALFAEEVLSPKAYYKEFLRGKLNPAQFRDAMIADKSLADYFGESTFNYDRISLTPPDEKHPTDTIVKYLADNNLIAEQDMVNMYNGFDEYRKHIRANYNHADLFTCIYPEDERLFYAMAKITKPEEVFAAGSYYGYITIWVMKTVRDNGGMCTLTDIDAEVCNLAKENYKNLGYENCSAIYNSDASEILRNRTKPIDMLILDATGSENDPRPEYRGKSIYGALLRDAKHLIHKDSAIIIHNMAPEMHTLIDELKSVNALGIDYNTFNGLGVYIVR